MSIWIVSCDIWRYFNEGGDFKSISLKDKLTEKCTHYLFTPMLMENQVKFRCGALQQNSVASFSLTSEKNTKKKT